MFKIEQSLLIQNPIFEVSLLSILDEYYKEMSMLINNIYLTHVSLSDKVGNVFPIKTNLYDASWYKNLLIASNIILDRFHNLIDPSIAYDSMFNNESTCDFVALANIWNKINFIIKYNLTDQDWKRHCERWDILATTHKIEKLITSNIRIDTSLLRTISLDMNSYKSVPKEIEDDSSFDNFIDTLTGKETTIIETEKSDDINNVESLSQDIKQVQNEDAYSKEQVPSSVNVKTNIDGQTRKELSPVKKEMDHLIKWIKEKESDLHAYNLRMKYGYDPELYKRIEKQLLIINDEKIYVDNQIIDAKKYMPISPLKKELEQLLAWINEKQAIIKKQNDRNSGKSLLTDLKDAEKLLSLVYDELNLVNEQTNIARQFLPKDPMLKELSTLNHWIEKRMIDVRAYKRKLNKNENINSELEAIEKEMAIVNNKLDDIDKNIVILNKNKPISPLKAEMDEVLHWINNKEKEVKQYKTQQKSNQTPAKVSTFANRQPVANDWNNSHKKNSYASQEMKELERELLENNEPINEPKSENNLVTPIKPTQPMIVKRQTNHDDDSNANIDNELKDILNEMSIVKEKYHRVNQQYREALEKYRIEAKILETAFEILPKDLKEKAFSKLPTMIDHLLHEGYISEDDDRYIDVKPVRNKVIN